MMLYIINIIHVLSKDGPYLVWKAGEVFTQCDVLGKRRFQMGQRDVEGNFQKRK